MFTPVKLGLIATATVAAAVPASIAYVKMSDDAPAGRTAPVVTTTIPATQIRPADPAEPVPGPTGAGPQAWTGPAPVPSQPPVATAPQPSAEEVVARVSASFETLALAAGAKRPGPEAMPAPGLPVVVGGRMVLPPVPAADGRIAPDLPPGVPREPPVPAAEAAPDPIVTAAMAPVQDQPEGATPLDVAALPVPKPAPREDKQVAVAGDVFAKSVDEYRQMVAREAEAQKIPPKLAAAIVEVESGYDPKRKGDDGKVGLTQINVRIARQFGYKGSEKDLADPETNLRWGLKYLAGAHRKAGGDVCRTAMKFQSGHPAEKPTAANRAYCDKVKQAMASL
ncbi:transglycosylase SLT domain-containing protein [Prosthecomicrobium sp. N25]|uniref:transglycosylase SLT domain-containing protein n=1 Tax=Prosthecomicrobium sp. N25 TaxID=3129254 RepID=UPI0030785016